MKKVFAFFVFTIITWAALFTVSSMAFYLVFNMDPINPDYRWLLNIWHTMCCIEFIPAILVGIRAARNDWWD